MSAYPVLERPDMAPGCPRPQAEGLPSRAAPQKGSSPCPFHFPFAKSLRRRVARAKHPAQPHLDDPPEYRFHELAAPQPVFDPVGQACPAGDVFEFVTVDPP